MPEQSRQWHRPKPTKKNQEALAVAATAAAAKGAANEKVAAAAVKAKGKKSKDAQKARAAGESTRGITTIAQHAHDTELPPDLDDWELSEGGLPEGSNLLGNKALLEGYPKDKAHLKKTKKANTGKRKKRNPKPMA